MIVPVEPDLEKDVAEEEGTLDVFLLTEGPVYKVRVVLAAGHVLDREVNVDSQHEVSGEACEDEKTDLGAASTDGLPVIKQLSAYFVTVGHPCWQFCSLAWTRRKPRVCSTDITAEWIHKTLIH